MSEKNNNNDEMKYVTVQALIERPLVYLARHVELVDMPNLTWSPEVVERCIRNGYGAIASYIITFESVKKQIVEAAKIHDIPLLNPVSAIFSHLNIFGKAFVPRVMPVEKIGNVTLLYNLFPFEMWDLPKTEEEWQEQIDRATNEAIEAGLPQRWVRIVAHVLISRYKLGTVWYVAVAFTATPRQVHKLIVCNPEMISFKNADIVIWHKNNSARMAVSGVDRIDINFDRFKIRVLPSGDKYDIGKVNTEWRLCSIDYEKELNNLANGRRQ